MRRQPQKILNIQVHVSLVYVWEYIYIYIWKRVWRSCLLSNLNHVCVFCFRHLPSPTDRARVGRGRMGVGFNCLERGSRRVRWGVGFNCLWRIWVNLQYTWSWVQLKEPNERPGPHWNTLCHIASLHTGFNDLFYSVYPRHMSWKSSTFCIGTFRKNYYEVSTPHIIMVL